MNAFLARFAHHDLSRHDQDFLARHGEILARLDRRQRRPQAACPDDRDEHHVGVRQARNSLEAGRAGKNNRLIVERGAQLLELRFIHQAKRLRPDEVGLRRQLPRVAFGREPHDLHPLRNVARHLQRALADRAGRAQHDDSFPFHLVTHPTVRTSHQENAVGSFAPSARHFTARG